MVKTITGIGLFIVALIILGIGAYVGYYFLNKKRQGKKASKDKEKKAAQAARTKKMRNRVDYFWKEPWTFAWIITFLTFFISLGFAVGTFYGLLSSIIFIIISIFFGLFAYNSYVSFPIKAKAELTKFEDALRKSLQNEISFEGDNIQKFSDKDDQFDTTPNIVPFVIAPTKIDFPPFEKVAGKKPIIATRKLEFLILSREYFSICQKASTFDLLNPKKANAGECDEYYYSQMQNVTYNGKAITIKYNNDTGHEDVSFVCKKGGDQKKAMKALKEKLRLTERQKLQKIQEHKHYEDLKDKRNAESQKIEESSKES
jgi:hypothetical protein